jgi:hypothetical protein
MIPNLVDRSDLSAVVTQMIFVNNSILTSKVPRICQFICYSVLHFPYYKSVHV